MSKKKKNLVEREILTLKTTIGVSAFIIYEVLTVIIFCVQIFYTKTINKFYLTSLKKYKLILIHTEFFNTQLSKGLAI